MLRKVNLLCEEATIEGNRIMCASRDTRSRLYNVLWKEQYISSPKRS